MEPRLDEAKEGKRIVLFVDAAHFVYGAFLGWLWCFSRIFIPSPSGRKRFNVLGALDAITHEMIVITNTSYINSLSVCALLGKIRKSYNNPSIPITLILDNARYQRCNLVETLAEELGIELLFLPPYSPNLNLIERLWKFIKKKSLNSRYHEDFDSFSRSITTVMSNAHTKYRNELDSLLSLKFQSFN